MSLLRPVFLAPTPLKAAELLGASPTGSTPQECSYRLGWPGRNPKRARCDAFAFDLSVSVSRRGGNDEHGTRFQQAWRAIKLLSRHADDDNLAGVLPFDQPSIGTVPPGPVRNPLHLATLKRALRTPPDAFGISELSASLALATTWAEEHPEHTNCLTVFSDFELFDDPGIFDRIRAYPGDVHAVVLGGQVPPDLYGERLTITEITPDSPAGSVAAATHRSLTATRPGRRLGTIQLDTRPSIPPLSPQGLGSHERRGEA